MEFTTNTVGSTIFQSLLVTREDNADEFVIKMLLNNVIDGLLPVSVIQKNLDLDVRYNVTSLIPLAQLMQEPMSKTKVMNVIGSIVKAAQNAEEYMLAADGLMMDEKYIYVNIADGCAYLVYLPITNPCKEDIIAFIKRMLTSFQYDSGEDSGYVLKFMNAFNSGSIQTVGELADFMRQMEKETKKNADVVANGNMSQVRSVPMQPEVKPQTVPTPVIPKPIETPVIPQPAAVVKEEQPKEKGGFLFGKNAAAKKAPAKPVKEKVKPEKQKNKLFGNKSVVDNNTPVIPVRIPGGANDTPAFAIPNQVPSAAIPAASASMVAAPVAAPVSAVAEKAKAEEKQAVIENNDVSGKPLTPQEESFAHRAPVMAGMPDYGNTIVMNQNNSNMTLMLDDMGNDGNIVLRASLTRASNNQKMFIEKNILKIGKESDYVDFYIGNNQTISRSHADIICEDGRYFVRDNNSKNHTYVNGQQIMPGQLVPIENNTEIKLSNEVFIFKLS